MIHLELCKKLKFDYTNKWYKHNPASVLENEMYKLFWDFEIPKDHQISTRRPDFILIKKKRKKRTCRIVDFAVLVDPRVKLKELEKRDTYLDLARELKNLWNMKVTIIPTLTKGLVQGLEDEEISRQVETIQTTALLRSARILRRVLDT